ncbi:hypothetical protein OBBRIDRAFT_823571 [Obba rivulosa]|uniref:RRM domain-containing protein n=1 Tax=Obba rivulosa TaxID=1052685 RepID=A0A8E2J3Z2_9APHY|nr:hypothetical protein OBBRIDRAFT_823571 [Obba rivulosa]
MNVVREINKINERELDLGLTASWHDDYKDSAYIFIGGLHQELTEGDVITIFSQYGEVMDVNLPRHKDTGKTKGFGFLMYEDQRSTVLAVDNLNGAKVLERTLRVDHVKNYKQSRIKGEDGEWKDREEQSLNARPEITMEDGAESDSSESSSPPIDPEDPMYDYLVAKRKEEKGKKKGKKDKKSKSKHKDETPEERRARKERKKLRKQTSKSEGMRAEEQVAKSTSTTYLKWTRRSLAATKCLRPQVSAQRSGRRTDGTVHCLAKTQQVSTPLSRAEWAFVPKRTLEIPYASSKISRGRAGEG